MMWGAGGAGWAWMGIGMLVWVVLIVAVVWIVVRVLARPEAGSGPPMAGWRGPAPAEELRMRFARGEISEEEYRSRLAVLNERTPGP